MNYLIYKITNKLNNKFYVGAHKTINKNDGYFGSGLLLGRSVVKYGKENFNKEILFECSSEEEMWQKEADIVDEEFIARDDTYNVKLGGCGGFDFVNTSKLNTKGNGRNSGVSDEKELMGMRNTFKEMLQDEKYKEEFNEKVSNSLKRYYLLNEGSFTNKKHTLETREKMSRAKIGRYTGKNNSQFGTMWITNGVDNRKVMRKDVIPVGWRKGRV